MPTNRRKTKRKIKQIPVSPIVWQWLNDEIDADEDKGFELWDLETDELKGRSLWMQHRDEVLRNWIEKHPGTRPRLWWEFDAPQKRGKGESESDYLIKNNLLLPAEKIKKEVMRQKPGSAETSAS